MSIIEQTLDKLDRASPSIPESFLNETRHFNSPHPPQTNEKFWVRLILSFCLLITLIFIFVSQGVNLQVSIAQKNNANTLSIEKDVENINSVNHIQLLKPKEAPIILSKLFKQPPHESKENIIDKTFSNIKIIRNKAPTTLKNQSDSMIESDASISDLSNKLPQQIAYGNYQDVIKILSQYEKTLDNSWEYHYWKSQAHTGMGELEEAEKTIDAGLKKDAGAVFLWVQKGIISQEKGDHKNAVKLFKKAELMPFKPESLYLNLGYSAAVLGDFLLSKRAYMTYLSLTKNHPAHDASMREQVIEYVTQMNKLYR